MTQKQKQWQLYLLGYYGDSLADIDGIFGEKSRAATLAFQKDFFEDDIAHDGLFGDSTEGKSLQVIDSIQDIVNRYTDYPILDDGLAGPATMAAVMAYQKAKGLSQTGRIDDTTWDKLMDELPAQSQPAGTAEDSPETFWVEIKFFTRKELCCKCGGRYCNGFPAEPQELVVRIADAAREHFGRPAHNVSFLRCQVWNAKCGGVANSQHMYGEAMDICIEGVSADELLAFLKKQPGVRYAYKINNTNVHFDIQKGKR